MGGKLLKDFLGGRGKIWRKKTFCLHKHKKVTITQIQGGQIPPLPPPQMTSLRKTLLWRRHTDVPSSWHNSGHWSGHLFHLLLLQGPSLNDVYSSWESSCPYIYLVSIYLNVICPISNMTPFSWGIIFSLEAFWFQFGFTVFKFLFVQFIMFLMHCIFLYLENQQFLNLVWNKIHALANVFCAYHIISLLVIML